MTVQTFADQIDSFEFDHPFTIHPDRSITDAIGTVYAPEVFHDDDADIVIHGDGWKAITGFTGQYGYSGAVMHPSERIGRWLAEYMAGLAADGPVTFVVVAVECLPDEGDDDLPEPAGWAILHRPAW